MAEKQASPGRELWLDGLRGVAALIVAWFHCTTGAIPIPYRSFWDAPASENRHLIQIAPFRVIFAGQAMVDIFFIVSGYSISTGLIRLRNEGSLADFYRKLTSSVVRRMFRLCFPVFVLILISHTLYYIGAYMLKFSDGMGCPGAEPWGSPVPHVQCMARSMFSIVNLQSDQELTLNNHLWTIPVEVKGSFQVYLTLLGLSTVSETARFLVIGLLAARSWWNGSPEFLAFFTGLLFAEIDGSPSYQNYNVGLPHSLTEWKSSKINVSHQTMSRLARFARYYLFALGVYLICLPAPRWKEGATDPTFQADWFFLSVFPPLPWWDWSTNMRTWHTFGAIVVVSCMRAVPRLRVPFETRVAQFLGYISFSLYLLHQTVFRIMLERCLIWTSILVSGTSYWDASFQGRTWVLFVAWALSAGLMGTVLMLSSRYMARTVDQKSVSIGFYMEKLLTRL